MPALACFPPIARNWIPFFGALLISLLICGTPAYAGDSASSLIAVTRQEALELALTRSDAGHIIRNTAKQERAAAASLTAFARPSLSLSASYVEMDDDAPPPLFDGFGSPSRQIFAGWQARQTIFAGGRIPAYTDLRRRREESADLGKRAGLRDIRANVRRSFDGILYQQALLRIMKDRIRQREEELTDARDLNEAGVVTDLDVRQARLALNAALSEKDHGDARLRSLLLDFHVLIGEPGGEPARIPEGQLKKQPAAGLLLNRISEAVRTRRQLDLAQSRNTAEQADALARASRAAFWPELALAASGDISGEEADDPTNAWRIGLEAQWLLFDGGRLRSDAAAATARLETARTARRQAEKELNAAREGLRSDFESLSRRINLQVESVDLAGLNYDDARFQYRAGIITQVTLGLYHLHYAENRFALQNLYFQRGNAVTDALYLAEAGEDPGIAGSTISLQSDSSGP